MRVGILTHYDVNNLGAQLQMYALYNKLKNMGHKPTILTYAKNFDFQSSEGLKNQVSIKSLPYYTKNYLLKKGLGLTVFNAKKYFLNKRFREKYFDLEHYASAEIDCAVVGSDEVFSIPVGVNVMMYGHGLPTNRVFSYAPSFGQTDMKLLARHNCIDLIASGLSRFMALSARDSHTSKLVQDLTGIEPEIVCDPVLLYDFSEVNLDVKLPKKKYLLVYSYDRWMVEPSEVAAIKNYAKYRNLITVSVGTFHKWCDRNIACNSLEWIEYFKGAEAIITDTFHGSILSIITQRPMAVFVRGLNSNKLTDLLERTVLNHRRLNVVECGELKRVFETAINFELVGNAVHCLRSQGTDFLNRALSLCQSS